MFRKVTALTALSWLSLPGCSATHTGGPDSTANAGGSGNSGAVGAAGSGGAGSGGTSAGGTGASGAGGSGAGGGGGGSTRDSGSDVAFDWPESDGGACLPGKYTGTFDCVYKDPQGVQQLPVTGPITLTLAQSQQGEFLEVRQGVLDGTANTFFSLRADITGKLDCVKNQFQGQLVNGLYSGFLIINGAFTGQLDSSYDPGKHEFVSGTWALSVVGPPGGTCAGMWSAAYAGP